MREQLDIEYWVELCAARRAQFVSFEIDEQEYRKFLARNGFSASQIKCEIDEARKERQQLALQEVNSRSNAA